MMVDQRRGSFIMNICFYLKLGVHVRLVSLCSGKVS